LLVDNLMGIYLHGSLAMGCFNPSRSDIDLLVVTRQGMMRETVREVARIALRVSLNPRPLEFSILRESYLHPWQYPTPFDFHFGEDWRDQTARALADETELWTSDPPQTDPDLAAHITITRACGICLVGKPIVVVFPDVPRADYVDSIMEDFEFARERIGDNP